MLSDTFAGIAPWSALGFVGAQVVGGLLGFLLVMAFVGRRQGTDADQDPGRHR
jgi:hypothetical protein